MKPLLFCLSLVSLCLIVINLPKRAVQPASPSTLLPHPLSSSHRLDSVAQRVALQKPSGYSDSVFLIDMRIPSGKNRFFVYDLSGDSVMSSGLVAHGEGSEHTCGLGSCPHEPRLTFSDKPGSLATSLGRYRIGEHYVGKFGSAFKLHGLDKTNAHALARAVVLHAHECVPASEVYPDEICLSWGCPTVSPGFLVKLEKYLAAARGNVMLYIYY